jgi:hypothetical protein
MYHYSYSYPISLLYWNPFVIEAQTNFLPERGETIVYGSTNSITPIITEEF